MEGHRIRPGERLELEIASSTAVTVKASCRILYDDGGVDILTIPERTTGSSRDLEGPAQGFYSHNARRHGWVTDAVVVATANVGRRGQTFCRLSIGPFAGGVLCMGYLYVLHVVPQGEFTEAGPVGGHGDVRTITTADPAANNEVAAEQVPTNAMWRPLSYRVQMVQGITDTPRPALSIITGGGTANGPLIPVAADVAVSTTVDVSWSRDAVDTTNNVTGGSMTAPMPDILLEEGDSIGTSTQGKGANSDYGPANLVVEEWIVF